MNLTFGICTTQELSSPQLIEVVQSIHALNIPEYEIIIAGSPPGATLVSGNPTLLEETDCHYHNEQVRTFQTRAWITRKKNLIAKYAKHDTLVLLHDYFVFDPQWYRAFEEFGYEWDICCCAQTLLCGRRHFTDWVADFGGSLPIYTSIDYDDWTHTKQQFISGGIFLVKKHVMFQYPFSEWMAPGMAEDVDWSKKHRDTTLIKCNGRAKVRHNKVHRDNDRKGFPFEQ